MYEIYLTTNLINNKKYIGQHKLSKNRDYYIGSGKLLKQAINKYGYSNFTKQILDTCETQEEANQLEKYYITLYNAVEDDNFYNLSSGGQDGTGFVEWRKELEKNQEQKTLFEEKRIKALKEWQDQNKDKVSELGKTNIKKCHKWCEEHKEFMREKAKNNQSLKKWAEEHPEEAKINREKGTRALKEWKDNHVEETKYNLSLGPKANQIASGHRVRCINTGEVFVSQREAERHYNLSKDSVGRCLRGKVKTAGKHPVTGERLKWEKIN